MLRYTSINYTLIKFIKQVLVNSNIGKKICINYIISNIGKVDVIKKKVVNSDKKVTK